MTLKFNKPDAEFLDDCISSIEDENEKLRSLCDKMAEALETVNPWCATSHGHVTCSSDRVLEALKEYHSGKGEK